jgi:hypothetical protein
MVPAIGVFIAFFALLLIYISWWQFIIIIIIHDVLMHNPCMHRKPFLEQCTWLKKTTIISWWGVQSCSLNFLGQLLIIMQNSIPMVDNQHVLIEKINYLSCVKLAYFHFSSSNCTVQVHILSTAWDAFNPPKWKNFFAKWHWHARMEGCVT